MRHVGKTVFFLSGAVVLSGCVGDVAPSGSTNPLFPDVGFAAEVSNEAVAACRNAVAAQTQSGVEVVGSEFSQAASVVYLVVGSQRAPWRCLSDNAGRVSEVMFVGSEGGA